MRLLVGSTELADLLTDRVGNGKMVLFKFGAGSGGDLLLKQFFDNIPEGFYSVWISTHQSEVEMVEELSELGIDMMPEMISFIPFVQKRLDEVEKKDKFITEGIMVTDLLEISSHSMDRMIEGRSQMKMLATITSTSLKQVLPFRMVIDSVVDLFVDVSVDDVVDRLMLLKKALREKGGVALIGCPIDFTGLHDHELTLFDAVIEVRAEEQNAVWGRKLTLKNIKGSGDPPEAWPVESIMDIPSALSVD
jgi:hypothetical protein